MRIVGQRRRISLRALSLAASILGGVTVVSVTVSLVAASRALRHSAETAEEEQRAVELTEELDRALREHRRLGNLWGATREPGLAATLPAAESDLRELVAEMKTHVRESGSTVDGVEARMVAELTESLEAYLAEYGSARRVGSSLEEEVRRVRPSFERALASSASIREHNEAGLAQTRADAERIIRLESMLAILSGVVLVAGSVVVALGVRLLVLRPLVELQGAMRRFQGGDADAKAGAYPSSELSDLAGTFNEMAGAIVQSRRDQLTFLAAVAHDLRNPLQALTLGVQALAREREPIAPQRCGRLVRQIERLSRMVGDLLDATRIEAGQLELQLEELDLRAAARAMVDLFTPTTAAHWITLEAPEHPVVVRGDSLRIEQVISNLLSNAIKYSPAGGAVDVVVSQTDGEAALSVSDHGVGIPAEEIPEIFVPFRRRAATADAIVGVGLGLSIVGRIVRAHGGRIDVESTPGAGSTFRVHLPLATAPR